MTEPIPAALASHPFIYWEDVRFRDLDVLAHVNNAVYATYFESARLAYYQSLTGKPLEEVDIILAELTITYHAPALYGDRLAIGVQVGSIGTKSFTMEYHAYRSSDATLIASGRSILVAYDYAQNRTVPVSESFRAAVRARQGGAS